MFICDRGSGFQATATRISSIILMNESAHVKLDGICGVFTVVRHVQRSHNGLGL